nr:hypothetical protein BdHM001_35200 [Bdellovibrio sp. HM001]
MKRSKTHLIAVISIAVAFTLSLVSAGILHKIKADMTRSLSERLRNQIILAVPESAQITFTIEPKMSPSGFAAVISGNAEKGLSVEGFEVCALIGKSEICSQFGSVELEDGGWISESELQNVRAQIIAASKMQGFSTSHKRYVLQNL